MSATDDESAFPETKEMVRVKVTASGPAMPGPSAVDSDDVLGKGDAMRVATFHRVSTGRQDEAGARAELARWCEASGATVVRAYEEVASGAAAKRPMLDEALQTARRREFDVLVCVRLDRLGRSLERILSTLREFSDAGVRVVVLAQGLDLRPDGDGSPMSRAMVSLLGVFAELERDLIRERTREGLATARRRGKRLGRPRACVDASRVVVLRGEGKSWRQISEAVGAPPSVVRRRYFEATTPEVAS